MRRPFDDATGKHTAKAPVEVDIFDPPIYAILAEVCAVCGALSGKPCHSIMGSHKERVYPHPVRIDAARATAARTLPEQ